MINSENPVSSILYVVYYKLKKLNDQDMYNIRNWLNNVDKIIVLSTKFITFAN